MKTIASFLIEMAPISIKISQLAAINARAFLAQYFELLRFYNFLYLFIYHIQIPFHLLIYIHQTLPLSNLLEQNLN